MKTGPASPTIQYHVLRLLLARGDTVTARQRLDVRLGATGLSRSERNRLLTLRAGLAQSLDEWLRLAPRVPCGVTNGDEPPTPVPDQTPYFDVDAAALLSHAVPLSTLRDVALGSALPSHLRRNVALTALLRAHVLDQPDTLLALLPALDVLAPELKADLADVRAARDRESRRFATLVLLLRFPHVLGWVPSGNAEADPLAELDRFGHSWWCGEPATADGAPPLFVDAGTREAAARERKALLALPSPTVALGTALLQAAKTRIRDPRVPESLHRLILATKATCRDEATTAVSRDAFRLLKRAYGASPWAEKTKYWY